MADVIRPGGEGGVADTLQKLTRREIRRGRYRTDSRQKVDKVCLTTVLTTVSVFVSPEIQVARSGVFFRCED